MPLSATLLDLRRELRAEVGASLNPAQGTQAQDAIDLLLARQQRELWDAYNWQHLKLWVDVPLAAGQAIYEYPAEMKFEQINEIMVAASSTSSWVPLIYGIRPHMVHASGTQQGTPQRWRNLASVDTTGASPVTNPLGQIELLPTPSSDGMIMRLAGQAPLSPLIADTDKCNIDSTAIVLFAAAEMMSVQKSEGAPMKLTKAQNYLRRLLQDQGADKRTNYNMGGVSRFGIDPDKSRRLVPYKDYIPG